MTYDPLKAKRIRDSIRNFNKPFLAKRLAEAKKKEKAA